MAAFSVLVCLLCLAAPVQADPRDSALEAFFPEADRAGEVAGEPPARSVYRQNEQIGLIFETIDVAPIPAYSGLPVNMLVGLDMEGVVTGVRVLEHSEPIMLVGIPERRLVEFVDQYVGMSIFDRVRVGLSARIRESYRHVDAVSGATVTVVVMGEDIMNAARLVAVGHRLVDPDAVPVADPATVKPDLFEPMDWSELREAGALSRLYLTRGEIDAVFTGTAAERVDNAPAGAEDDTFIGLYLAYLNAPTAGRNLLGDAAFERLMERLDDGEHAIFLAAHGRYSFKGTGFARGGIFDRIQINQGDSTIHFRDADLVRAPPRIAAAGAPAITERDIFIIRSGFSFDPGRPWDLNLLVRRQVGALESVFFTFPLEYEPPQDWFDFPEPPRALPALSDRPLWMTVWEERTWQIGVLGAGLLVLVLILMFQDWLVKRPRLLHRIRITFLLYTVFFIGWYALAQLSVVNILTFTHALLTGFQWSTFLMDPMIFIMWSFVAVTLLLWGRGVYCGWLCPFGAMQELINDVARKLKVPQYELPFAIHERLWSIKYLILIGLFGISLHSPGTAEVYAEVEPFKTVVIMRFGREWGFVLYALILLAIGVFNRKFFCRYMCPLGAGLAIPARLRLFDWLKRHQECGSPCQICANECEVQAIHPNGRINPNECHYCLDCQVTYFDDHKCPPMIMRRKRSEKASRLVSSNDRVPLKVAYN